MERENYPRMSAAVENFDCILGQALVDFHRSGIMSGQSFDAARKLKLFRDEAYSAFYLISYKNST